MNMVIPRSRPFATAARWVWIALVIVLLVGLWILFAESRTKKRPNGQDTPAEPPQASYQTYMESAASLEDLQQVEYAAKAYAQAVAAASSKQETVEAQLAWAGVLSRHLGNVHEAGGRVKKAEDLYRTVLQKAEGDQRLRARNDYGVFLFRQEKAAKAAEVLGQLDHASWPGDDGPARQARYLYNYGQVLERLGRNREAYSRYLEAMRLDPRFGLASEAATRLATNPAPAAALPASDQMQLVKVFLDQSRYVQADGLLRELAAHPDRLNGTDSKQFASLILTYLIDARVEPESFAQNWAEPTERLQQVLPLPAAGQIREVRSAFLAELPVELKSGASAGTFQAWRDAGQAKPFAQLLKSIGDDYVESGDLRQSLERYAQAASLDPTNAEPALYFTTLLVQHSEQLDPKGELLGHWLQELDTEREGRYALKDPERLVYLHSLLAAHFEEEKRWGPEEDPQSAVFQWKRALTAQAKLSEADPESAKPRPLLNERLALAYEGSGQRGRAADEYRAAARGYEKLAEAGKAVDLRARADVLEHGTLPGVGDGDEVQMADADSYDESDYAEDTLPAGASPWPLVALGGLLCLLAAVTIRIARH